MQIMEKVIVGTDECECLDFNEEIISVAELKLRIKKSDFKLRVQSLE
jgi:hypothetical protein